MSGINMCFSQIIFKNLYYLEKLVLKFISNFWSHIVTNIFNLYAAIHWLKTQKMKDTLIPLILPKIPQSVKL